MSVERINRLFCDGCSESYGDGLLDLPMPMVDQRWLAKKDKWVRMNKMDFCPKCATEKLARENKNG